MLNKRSNFVVFFIFWLVLLSLYKIDYIYNQLLHQYISEWGSEYSLREQLSKSYLLITILISILAYDQGQTKNEVKKAISIFTIGLVFYLAESNFLTAKAEPIFAIVMLSYAIQTLYNDRSYGSIIILFTGFFFYSSGYFQDLISESKVIIPPNLGFISSITYLNEEFIELLGAGVICYLAIITFDETIKRFINNNRRVVFLVMLSSLLISFGNGFLHWMYYPSSTIQFPAYIITFTGFILLIITNHYLIKGDLIKLVSEDLFYIFIFFFFLALPTIYGGARYSITLGFWFPTIFGLGIYLYYKHPLIRKLGLSE